MSPPFIELEKIEQQKEEEETESTDKKVKVEENDQSKQSQSNGSGLLVMPKFIGSKITNIAQSGHNLIFAERSTDEPKDCDEEDEIVNDFEIN